MTKEEWRNLQPGQLVTFSDDVYIYEVVSVGWDDMEEKDFQDDKDYVITVKDLFGVLKGHFIVRAQHTDLFNIDIPKKVMEAASEADNPYDFLDGYFTFKNDEEKILSKETINIYENVKEVLSKTCKAYFDNVLSDGDWQHYSGWKLAGENIYIMYTFSNYENNIDMFTDFGDYTVSLSDIIEYSKNLEK